MCCSPLGYKKSDTTLWLNNQVITNNGYSSMNIQGWFPLGLTGLISLQSKGLLQHHNVKASILQRSAFFMVHVLHPYVTMEKPYLWLYRPLSAKWCFCFLIHCRSFPSKEQTSFNFMTVVTICSDFVAQENKKSLLYNFRWTINYKILNDYAVATHSSVLAWRIPGTGEPGGLPSMGSHRVGHDWSNLAAEMLYIRN